MSNQYNPIRTVNGAAIPCPATYKWDLQDVSSKDAGRSESGLMDKMRITQKRKLEMTWRAPTIEDAATILTAFNPEYVSVEYIDAMTGDFQTRTFYTGDRNSNLYSFNPATRRWSDISFHIIER